MRLAINSYIRICGYGIRRVRGKVRILSAATSAFYQWPIAPTPPPLKGKRHTTAHGEKEDGNKEVRREGTGKGSLANDTLKLGCPASMTGSASSLLSADRPVSTS